MAVIGAVSSASLSRPAISGAQAMVCMKKVVGSVVRDFIYDGQQTAPTLVVPSLSGMNQNQPCSNQTMVMLPSALPSLRRALRKWPKIAALACFLFFLLMPKRSERNVSRPEASTRNRVRQVWVEPS